MSRAADVPLHRIHHGAAAIIAVVVACGGGDGADATLEPPSSDAFAPATDTAASGNSPRSPNAPECADPAKAPPLRAFPKCCTKGRAHCVPSAVLGDYASEFSSCPTNEAAAGSCVPDPLLVGGKLASCTSFGEAAGACHSVCVPQVEAYAELLPRSTCAEDERCVPCVSPLDGQSTGACDDNIGILSLMACLDERKLDASVPEAAPPPKCPHDGPPVIDPKLFAACSPDERAHCLPTSFVPSAQQAALAPCTTKSASTGRCVPDIFIETGGRFILPACDSIGGGEGRCVHVAIPAVGAHADRLPQSTCEAYERCGPCFDPIDGRETGLCRLGCDPGPSPSRAVYTFPACCQDLGGGRCLPERFLPAASRSSMRQDTCASGDDRCVPSEHLDPGYVPPSCTAFSPAYLGNYAGVCLSRCFALDTLHSIVVQQGTCPATKQCVPCRQPTGEPTNAPGCP